MALDWIESYLVKDRVNHVEHAFVTEFVLIAQIIKVFPAFVLHLLRDWYLFGLQFPQFSPKFVDLFIILLSFLAETQQIDRIVNYLPLYLLIKTAISAETWRMVDF